MAKLTLRTVKVKVSEDKENKKGKEETILSPTQPQNDGIKSPVTPGNFKNLKQQKLSFSECEKTDASPPTATEKMTQPPAKKRKRSTAEM